MSQFTGQHEWLMKFYKHVQDARSRWLRRQVTNVGTKGNGPRLAERQMEHLQTNRAPVVRDQRSDDELLVSIVQGNDHALGALYDRHGALVFSIALRSTGTQCAAEAVTQDVFQHVWHHADCIQGGTGSTSGWIAGIARAVALEEICSGQDTLQTHSTVPGITASPTPLLGLNSEEAAGSQSEVEVRAALARLSVDQCQALELVYYGGLTTCELAAALNVSNDVVRTRLRLSLQQLRDVLGSGVAAEEHHR